MEQYETDEQRGEAFKEWLMKNVPIIVLGIVIGLGGVYGYKYYMSTQLEAASKAGDVFYKILQATEQNDIAKASELVKSIDDDKNASGYLGLSQLALSKLALSSHKTEQGITFLENLINSDADASLKALAQYRIARIYFDQNNDAKSLDILSKLTDSGFQGLRKELEGDIYLSQSKLDDAIIAFKAASVAGGATKLLPMKLESVGIKQNDVLNEL
jgi:predicted negative regulator of RcsB-dependent stress response